MCSLSVSCMLGTGLKLTPMELFLHRKIIEGADWGVFWGYFVCVSVSVCVTSVSVAESINKPSVSVAESIGIVHNYYN